MKGVDGRFFRTIGVLRRRGNVPTSCLCSGVSTTVIITTGRSCGNGSVIRYSVSPRGRGVGICMAGGIIRRIRSPSASLALRRTRRVHGSTGINGAVSVPLGAGRFNEVVTRGTGRIVHRNVHRTRHNGRLTRFRDGGRRLMATGMGHVSPMANDTAIRVNGAVTILPGVRRVPNRIVARNRGLGVFIISIGSSNGNPGVVVSHARPNLMEELFRARIPRVCSNAVRVGSISHRTNSEAGVTICDGSSRVSPVNTYVNPGNRHISGVISTLNKRGVSVIGCDSSITRFISTTLTPTSIYDIRVLSRSTEFYHTAIPSSRLDLTVNGGNRGIHLTTGLAN